MMLRTRQELVEQVLVLDVVAVDAAAAVVVAADAVVAAADAVVS